MSKNKQPWWQGMQCAYCPDTASSEDHIPPRCLYGNRGKGLPLVVVPSCEVCRQKSTKDDEFFKTLLVKAAGDTNPVSKSHLLGSVGRAMKRLVIGLGPKIANQTVEFDLLTESGIYTGDQMLAIKIGDEDWRRIQVVLIRIVRGLNYRFSKWKERYDDHWYSVVDFESEDGRKILNNRSIMEPLQKAKTIALGDEQVCKAKVVRYETVKNAHLWSFEFFGRKRFFVLALPRQYAEGIVRRRGDKFMSPSGILH